MDSRFERMQVASEPAVAAGMQLTDLMIDIQ
jgi:hypothetical protein